MSRIEDIGRIGSFQSTVEILEEAAGAMICSYITSASNMYHLLGHNEIEQSQLF